MGYTMELDKFKITLISSFYNDIALFSKKKKVGLFLELWLPLFFITYYSIAYLMVASIASSRSVDYASYLTLSIDKNIPFMPLFIIPYLGTWLITPLYVYYMAYYNSMFIFRRYCLSLFFLSFLLALFYILFPVHYPFRINLDQLINQGLISDLIFFNYQSQPAWNEFPSSHIAFPWLTLRIISLNLSNKLTLLFKFFFWIPGCFRRRYQDTFCSRHFWWHCCC